MRVKSYYAGTVEGAIRTARQELGEEAILMTSRKAPPEARHLGVYEVVFAADDPGVAAPRPPDESISPKPAPAPDRLSRELAELRRQFERLSGAFFRVQAQGALHVHPGLDEVCAELSASDLDPVLILEVARRVDAQHLGRADPEAMREALWQELGRQFEVAAEPADSGPGAARRVVAVVGPPGAGKTTTLVKLAFHHGLASRRPSQFLAADPHRVGAADLLRSFATILGVGFDTAETPAALTQALEESSRRQWIWIDTPGYAPAEMDPEPVLARLFRERPDIETHLVLSATTRPADLMRMVDRYAVFRPTRLIFTRLDETENYGAIVSEAHRTGLPVSYLSGGPRIPDDLEAATSQRILELVLSRPPEPGRERPAGSWGLGVAAAAGRKTAA